VKHKIHVLGKWQWNAVNTFLGIEMECRRSLACLTVDKWLVEDVLFYLKF